MASPGPVLALKFPAAMATGELPTLIGEFGNSLKVPSPLPSRMVTLLVVWLTIARSSLPSPLKSAAAMAMGPVAVTGKVSGEAASWVKAPSPLPLKTEMVLSVKLVVMKPRLLLVLVLNAPMTIALGCWPTAMGLGWTVTVLATGSVTRRSGRESVSGFKLPTPRDAGTAGAAVRAVPREIGELA